MAEGSVELRRTGRSFRSGFCRRRSFAGSRFRSSKRIGNRPQHAKTSSKQRTKAARTFSAALAITCSCEICTTHSYAVVGATVKETVIKSSVDCPKMLPVKFFIEAVTDKVAFPELPAIVTASAFLNGCSTSSLECAQVDALYRQRP
ncbi:MAG: hypothetical protein V8S24_09020 [Gordonibacter pamelaeae]